MIKADYLLKSNAVFTGMQNEPFAGAVAVKDNRILEVIQGDTKEDYPAEHIIDCGDRLIMPGFIDNHDHYFVGAVAASEYMNDKLTEATSEEHCVQMMVEYEKAHPGHSRVRGIGWMLSLWGDAPLPTKKSLDAAFPDKPVYLISADCHTLWLNSCALEEAGITADMNPRSGCVCVDENGEMTGILQEPDAFTPAMQKVLDFPVEDMIKINQEFVRKASECGVTGLSDMSADDAYSDDAYKKFMSMKEMDERGLLNARLHIYTELAGHTEFKKAQAWMNEFCSEKFRICGVKGFVDGVTSTYTALLLKPYSDRPETCGIGVPIIPREEMEKSIIAANAKGIQVRLHCIGDGAVRMALDMFEASEKVNGKPAVCNGIEHIESIDPEDIHRFAELDIIAAVQPYHLPLDEMEKVRRIGKERCRWEWPFKSFLEAGTKISFGTDYPVVDFNPYPSIYVAMTRKTPDGKDTCVNMDECISLADALKAYTVVSAQGYGRDDVGVLEAGKLADINVVDRNLFDAAPEEILEAKTDMTMFDGKIIFRRSDK